jgi:hypothetical protein
MKNVLVITFFCMVYVATTGSMPVKDDDVYEPLGTVVLVANGLLLAQYPHGIPAAYPDSSYKNLLRKGYKSMYARLKPYHLELQKNDSTFIVRLFDGKRLVLTDWSCTEEKIDCWNYKGECEGVALKAPCQRQ